MLLDVPAAALYALRRPRAARVLALLRLGVVKAAASKGFHPSTPRFGYGDPQSYDIIANVVDVCSHSGAVRHGPECFNFYFPQELDTQFLIVWQGFTRYLGKRHAPWQYVSRSQLRDFLLARIDDGYSFPLNPKWIVCDRGWGEVYDKLRAAPHAQDQLATWLPPSSGLQEHLTRLVREHPNGFQPETSGTQQGGAGVVVDDVDQDMADWELHRHVVLHRAKIKLRALYLMGGFKRQPGTGNVQPPNSGEPLQFIAEAAEKELEDDEVFTPEEDVQGSSTQGDHLMGRKARMRRQQQSGSPSSVQLLGSNPGSPMPGIYSMAPTTPWGEVEGEAQQQQHEEQGSQAQPPLSPQAVVQVQSQAQAEDDFLLADTSGDGLVDEGELVVLFSTLLQRRGEAIVDEGLLAGYLLRFRTEAQTPLELDFDSFVNVYNSFLEAQQSGELARALGT